MNTMKKVWIKANGHWCNDTILGGKRTLSRLSNNMSINGYCVLLPDDQLEFEKTGHTTINLVKGCLTGSNNCFFDGNPEAIFDLDKPVVINSQSVRASHINKAVIETEIFYKKDLTKMLGVSGMTLDRWSQAGEMPAHFLMVGRRAWPKRDIDQWLEEKQKQKD